MDYKPHSIYLDFDGVIADSAYECINTTICAFDKLALENPALSIQKDEVQKIKSRAIENRFLVLPPEHFYCLIKAVKHFAFDPEIDQEQLVDRFHYEVNNASAEILNKFKKLFFAKRALDSTKLTNKQWFTENPATAFINQFMTLCEDRNVKIKIVSRKDEASLLKWISGSPFRFDEVYGNRELALEGNSKFSLISKLQTQNDMNNSIFIDDAPNEFAHHDWKAVGVATLVAGWGYNGLNDNTTEVLNIVEEWLNDFAN